MNQYETVFILTPVLSDVQTKEAVKEYETVLKNYGAKLVHQEHWGLRKLAYPIQKKSTGFYQLFEFEAPTDAIKKIEVEMRRDEKIMRFLTTRLDKNAGAWALKRRTQEGGPKTPKEII
jgi:small subunit ribosomal protein S6